MKWKLLVPVVLFALACSRLDHTGQWLGSSDGRYQLQTTVDRADEGDDHYALVMIHVADSAGHELTTIDTRAGDAMKWSVNWSVVGDTILLQSSDIGSRKWVMVNGEAQP